MIVAPETPKINIFKPRDLFHRIGRGRFSGAILTRGQIYDLFYVFYKKDCFWMDFSYQIHFHGGYPPPMMWRYDCNVLLHVVNPLRIL